MKKSKSIKLFSRLCRIYKALKDASQLADNHPASASFEALVKETNEKFNNGLNDDLNTPIAFAALFELVRQFNNELASKKKKDPQLKGAAQHLLNIFKEKSTILALFNEDPNNF